MVDPSAHLILDCIFSFLIHHTLSSHSLSDTMAKPRRAKTRKKPVTATFGPRLQSRKPVLASFLFLMGVLHFLATWDYRPDQQGFFTVNQTGDFGRDNMIGQIGAEAGFWSLRLLGLSALFVGPILIRFATLLIQKAQRQVTPAHVLGAVVFILGSCGLFQLGDPEPGGWATHFPVGSLTQGKGGTIGILLIETYLEHSLGKAGSTLLMGSVLLAGFILLFRPVWMLFIHLLNWMAMLVFKGYRSYMSQPKGERKVFRLPDLRPVSLPFGLKAKRSLLSPLFGKPVTEAAGSPMDPDYEASNQPKVQLKKDRIPSTVSAPIVLPEPPRGASQAAMRKTEAPVVAAPPPPRKELAKKPLPRPELPAPDSSSIKIIASEKTEKKEGSHPKKKGRYQFPPIHLLEESAHGDEINPDDHQMIAERLRATLEEFNIKVTLGEVHIGPVITRYDLHPAPGVRVEKIASLDRNIAMALQAQSVRILAPVPGKGCVGIEIPNPNPQSVRVRDIIESKAWADAKAEIPVVLGKEVSGKPLVADLTKMPHLLIAGSTGSGKTVCINAIITSLLYHASPDDVRFIMVDPKIVEMQVFNSLPHMLIPVVTDPKRVPNALKWLISEMERRYRIFAQAGVRNIAGFNAKIIKSQESKDLAHSLDQQLTPEERSAINSIGVPRDELALDEVPNRKLPYIVCIVDELADLMMVAPADIETCIARLAQLARAAGIHLILATQRPSVNVITGVIKANLPSRIAFKVASKVDSRTILDGGGADALIGKGDMLFVPPGAHHLVRAQGAFVSDDELNGIVEFLKVNGPPRIAEDIQRQIESDDDGASGSSGEDDGDDAADSMISDAIEVLRTTKRASTSMLQRRLRIGYNRAARIMETLEDRGIVGPDNGSQPREILKDLDSL